jgi:hypothetical protein
LCTDDHRMRIEGCLWVIISSLAGLGGGRLVGLFAVFNALFFLNCKL